ncbi:hypothetical protein HZH66_000887 [Vespula vulgaris]|uniref:Uncharacterized protein n=1 Tax=Vespula vulgaris TaxID=7454 RepID=A0A834KXQ2_VESVU|nr:hypothetical protein HZH66_000887 [Vespula vulgaris]
MTVISIKRYPTKYNKCSEQFVSVALTTESCVYENLESRDTDSYGILAVLENERQPHSIAFFSKGKIKQQKRLRLLSTGVMPRKRSHYEQQNVFRQSSGAVPAFSMLRSQQLPPPLPSPSPSFHLYPFFTVSSILPRYQSIPFCSPTARFLMDTMSTRLEANHLHNPDFFRSTITNPK